MGQQGVAWIAAAVGALPDVSATPADRQKVFDAVSATAARAAASRQSSGNSSAESVRCRSLLLVNTHNDLCACEYIRLTNLPACMFAGNLWMLWKSFLNYAAGIAIRMILRSLHSCHPVYCRKLRSDCAKRVNLFVHSIVTTRIIRPSCGYYTSLLVVEPRQDGWAESFLGVLLHIALQGVSSIQYQVKPAQSTILTTRLIFNSSGRVFDIVGAVIKFMKYLRAIILILARIPSTIVKCIVNNKLNRLV